jgi:hypothetical protein
MGILAHRVVECEMLDALPASDLRAIHSRRDLALLNRIMMQARLMSATMRLAAGEAVPSTVAEIGCGDGTLMLAVARRLAGRWPAVRLVLIDRLSLVRSETLEGFARLGWTAEPVVADAFYALETMERVDLLCANLFLHHFEGAALDRLLTLVAARSRAFAACEPARTGLGLVGSRLVGAIGCNGVTRHDAVASVMAGFRGHEISDAWPSRLGGTMREWRSGPFTQSFLASGRKKGGHANAGRAVGA